MQENPIPHSRGACSAKKNQLIQALKDGIQSGFYRPGKSIPSEHRLAELLRLSRPTVHQGILELQNDLILRREGQKMFVTDAALKLLETTAVSNHHVVVVNRNDSYRNPIYLDFFRALVKHLPESTRCEIRFCQNAENLLSSPPPAEAVTVILGHWLPETFSGSLGRNAIFINDQRKNANFIAPDNYNGGRQIAEHLWKLGHRRIAVTFLAQSDEGAPEFVERHRGIVDALAAHRETVITLGAARWLCLEDAYAEIFQTFLKNREITALITLKDILAVEMLTMAQQAGLNVPEDFSLAGFDDSLYGAYLTPTLTSVRYPVQEIALLTAQAIREAFERPAGECFCQQKVIPLLLERGSTATVQR